MSRVLEEARKCTRCGTERARGRSDAGAALPRPVTSCSRLSTQPALWTRQRMHRYQVGEKLGDGTYGEVLRATNKTSGEVVAIKRFRTYPSR